MAIYLECDEVWDEDYDQACDLWSAGVIMFVLLSSSLPFNGDSDKDILRKVLYSTCFIPGPLTNPIDHSSLGAQRKFSLSFAFVGYHRPGYQEVHSEASHQDHKVVRSLLIDQCF